MMFTNDHIRKSIDLANKINELDGLAEASGMKLTPEIKAKIKKASNLMQEISNDLRMDFAEAMKWEDFE